MEMGNIKIACCKNQTQHVQIMGAEPQQSHRNDSEERKTFDSTAQFTCIIFRFIAGTLITMVETSRWEKRPFIIEIMGIIILGGQC